ncbi:hypothetical protein Q604_UNBC07044G0001, partial [human gut metagenome]
RSLTNTIDKNQHAAMIIATHIYILTVGSSGTIKSNSRNMTQQIGG